MIGALCPTFYSLLLTYRARPTGDCILCSVYRVRHMTHDALPTTYGVCRATCYLLLTVHELLRAAYYLERSTVLHNT